MERFQNMQQHGNPYQQAQNSMMQNSMVQSSMMQNSMMQRLMNPMFPAVNPMDPFQNMQQLQNSMLQNSMMQHFMNPMQQFQNFMFQASNSNSPNEGQHSTPRVPNTTD
jgi:hypothetical protein